jgi:hypothetical protein
LDTNAPLYTNGTNGGSGASFGFDVGGGLNLNHQFESAFISLGYRGDYRDYTNSSYYSGTNQTLALSYGKRLSRRWSLGVTTNAGISLYGSNYFLPNTPVANPFSAETRFLSSGLNFTYQQTRRLSYSMAGFFFLTRYNYPGAVGTTGASGAFSATYRLTARTSVGGTYSHSDYYYQQNVGNSQIDNLFATVSHTFTRSTKLFVSGGIAHVNSHGNLLLTLGETVVNGVPVIEFERVPYNVTSWIPAFNVTVAHSLRRFEFTVSGGQTVTPGNGFFLTSRNLFINGNVSRSWLRTNLSAGGGYFHLVTIADATNPLQNTNLAYNTFSFRVVWSRTLNRYFGVHAAYNYFKNSNYGGFNGYGDNRFLFGINFSSRGIPMTLF